MSELPTQAQTETPPATNGGKFVRGNTAAKRNAVKRRKRFMSLVYQELNDQDEREIVRLWLNDCKVTGPAGRVARKDFMDRMAGKVSSTENMLEMLTVREELTNLKQAITKAAGGAP